MGLIRGEIQQNEGLCVCICSIFNSKKWVSPFLICDLCYDFYFLQQKGDERKRNETRFDTITVSSKAIWLVLGSVFYLLLFCCSFVQNSRVFLTYEKYLHFSRYNLTASKLLSFSRFFGNKFCSNAFCGHRQLFGRISSSELLIIKFSSLRFSSCFLFWVLLLCNTHARERKQKGTTFCVTPQIVRHAEQIWLISVVSLF